MYCDSNDLKVGLTPADSRRLVETGMRIKRAVMTHRRVQHPIEKDLGFVYGTIISGRPGLSADIRNVCVFADGQIDRSPTGTGVSGHVALEHFRGNLSIGSSITVESIIGTVFKGTAVREGKVGECRAVVPRIEGSGWTSGRGEFWLDPSDPLGDGFIVE